MPPIWREGNRFTLLPEASRFLPAMLDAIRHAKHDVRVELYLMESGTRADQVSEALIQAVSRGGVRIYAFQPTFIHASLRKCGIFSCVTLPPVTPWMPLAGRRGRGGSAPESGCTG